MKQGAGVTLSTHLHAYNTLLQKKKKSKNLCSIKSPFRF